MIAQTLNTSIVLDSIYQIEENTNRVLELLVDYDDQLDLRLGLADRDGSESNIEQFNSLKQRNGSKLRTARELLEWCKEARHDFEVGKLSAQLTVSNANLAAQMLRLIDPAVQEQGQ